MLVLVFLAAFLVVANGLAARFHRSEIGRAVFWSSVACPFGFFAALALWQTSRLGWETAVLGGGLAIVWLAPPLAIGAGVLSLVGQFFGKLLKGDFR